MQKQYVNFETSDALSIHRNVPVGREAATTSAALGAISIAATD
jgi:hypothetical protein